MGLVFLTFIDKRSDSGSFERDDISATITCEIALFYEGVRIK